MDQPHYVGLDVSLETTSVCVIANDGAVVWRGKCATDPDTICQTVGARAPSKAVQVESMGLALGARIGMRRAKVAVVKDASRRASGVA